jgi:hypothetical protein
MPSAFAIIFYHCSRENRFRQPSNTGWQAASFALSGESVNGAGRQKSQLLEQIFH